MTTAESMWEASTLAEQPGFRFTLTAPNGAMLQYVRGRTDGDTTTITHCFALGAISFEFVVEEGGDPRVIDPEIVDFYFHGALTDGPITPEMLVAGVKAMVTAISNGRRSYRRARISIHL